MMLVFDIVMIIREQLLVSYLPDSRLSNADIKVAMDQLTVKGIVIANDVLVVSFQREHPKGDSNGVLASVVVYRLVVWDLF